MSAIDQINQGGTTYEIVPEIAELFSIEKTYRAGDHVIYEAGWYTFKTDKYAGAWDATKVDGPFKVTNELSSLKSDLSEIRESVTPVNIFNGDYWDTDGYLSGRNFVENANYKTTKPIYLDAGDYMFTGFPNSFGGGAYNASKCNSDGSVISFVGGVDTNVSFYRGTIVAVTLAEAGYYRFNCGSGSNINTFVLAVGNNVNVFPASYSPYFEPYTIIPKDVIDNSGIIYSETAQGENLFDGSFCEIEGYFGGNRNIIPMSDTCISNPIYLKAGTYYYNLKNDSYGASAFNFAETINTLTGNNDILASMVSEDTGSTLKIGTVTYNINKATIIHDGYYAFNANRKSVSASFMIVKGDSASDFPNVYVAPYTAKKVKENIHLSDTMKADIASLGVYNPLVGKKLTVNGDSICYGADFIGGYAKIIADQNGMTVQNIAVGGGTITAETYSESTPRHWICRSISNMDADSDYALIEGGVNDSSLSIALGDITDGYAQELDDTTFYGAVESCLKQLITRFAGKKYGFIIPHQMTSNYRIVNDPATSYYWAIIKSCEKWGVPYIDLNKAVPPLGMFASTASDLYALRQTYTKNGDGWHPTEECYRKYYVPKIEAWMKTL